VNPELTVIAISGDGDAYGEGGNHFIHAMRRNHDITYLVHNNQVYGLTKGQASPTSDEGFVTKTTPHGATASVNPIALAVAAGASFIGRSFAGDIEHLSNLIKQGIMHKGFALIDILQPFVSFNQVNTFAWYRQRIYKLDSETSYDPTNRVASFNKAIEWGDRIPIGVIYRREQPTFEEKIPTLSKEPLVKQRIDPKIAEPLLDEFL
jgi:2-oxoglutarate ferredoxin oxidoreductase subunit beta